MYLKKAGQLASRNIVHRQKKFFVVSVSQAFIFFIFHMKPIRSLYRSNVYQQDHRSACLLIYFIVVLGKALSRFRFNAILTGRQKRSELQFLYGNLMANYFFQTNFTKL